MGLGNLKPNIVVMQYPEIWRPENLTQILSSFISIINVGIIANKAIVIVKGLDEWPNEYTSAGTTFAPGGEPPLVPVPPPGSKHPGLKGGPLVPGQAPGLKVPPDMPRSSNL
jgi:hypothetical protein